MVISGVGVGISEVGMGFQEISPNKPEKQAPQRKRAGTGRSLGKGLGGNDRMRRETFLPVRAGSPGWGGGGV